jgi:SAM-dependent methyltransferase
MKKLIVFLKKIKNTFFTPRWNYIFLNYDKNFSKSNKKKFFFLFLSKIWFMPYDIQSRYWHSADEKSRHSFKHYRDLNYEAKLLLKKVKKYSISKNTKILDLGCNVGRHLNHLRELKYNNLYGVDIGKLPIKKSKILFSNLKKVKLNCSSFENYLYKTKSRFFDIIYTHGATIEMTKPTFPLIFQISRVLKNGGHFILLIDENGHSYPRFWRYEFKKNNFITLYDKNLVGNHTIFVLKKKN